MKQKRMQLAKQVSLGIRRAMGVLEGAEASCLRSLWSPLSHRQKSTLDFCLHDPSKPPASCTASIKEFETAQPVLYSFETD